MSIPASQLQHTTALHQPCSCCCSMPCCESPQAGSSTHSSCAVSCRCSCCAAAYRRVGRPMPPHAPAFLPSRFWPCAAAAPLAPLALASAAFFSASSLLRLASSSLFCTSGSVSLLNRILTLVPLSMGSRGSLRNLWLRQRDTTFSTSATVTSLRPSYATRALAARFTTMSPRRPSTSRREQMSEMSTCSSSDMRIPALSLLRASTNFCRRASCTGLASAYRASGSVSYARRSRTIWVRRAVSCRVATCTDIPKRSSSWGRSSPSAGFPEPIMMNLAGCTMEIPSRSTVLTPDAEESSTTSTSPSSSRFTSSTYRMPRLALASRPGS
mmetsp:Transcript_5544/g.12273  ORF Transcript_5544/g.12273 Transcript_5544/m.12273 type:complete len:327 (+) Transcript_5544:696-1676(+)